MVRYISIITFILCCCCACNQHHETKGDTASSDDAFHSFVMQVQKCSRIYTTEVKIHKIVTHDDVIRLKGTILAQDFNIKMPLGDRKIAIPMDATLKAFIDMSDFSEKNVERDGQKIIITLPDPQVTLTSSKIDQKGIKEYVGLVRSHKYSSIRNHIYCTGKCCPCLSSSDYSDGISGAGYRHSVP